MNIKDFTPIACNVKAGQEYYWCGCGRSETQPFCDRENCGEQRVVFRATLNETLYFCNCKATKDPPLCDGSHAKLLLAAIQKRKSER